MHFLFYALGSNVSFAVASYFFTEFSRRLSPYWMNFFKSLLACTAFGLVTFFYNSNTNLFLSDSFLWLCLSGFLGLFVGDIFLLKAFKELGAGRVLMIFGFQPLFLGVASFLLFNESYSWSKLIAIIFLVICLFSFSFESYNQKGHWDFKGLMFAILGVSFDGAGLLITKFVFLKETGINVFEVNFIRTSATVLCFLLSYKWLEKQKPFLKSYFQLSSKDKFWTVVSSLLGTFVSLALYLRAVQLGSLAVVTALSGTSPLLATIVEVILGRKKVSLYLLIATISFLCGLCILVYL